MTIGNFDGHHLGHRALLDRVVSTARRESGTALVLTFDPHPVKIPRSSGQSGCSHDAGRKAGPLEAAGIDEVVFLEFTTAFAALSPAQFAKQVLCDGIGTRELFVGEHFAFREGAGGRIADLLELGGSWGFECIRRRP